MITKLKYLCFFNIKGNKPIKEKPLNFFMSRGSASSALLSFHFWAIFENTLKLIRDQLFLLGRWYLHDHQHLINHMNELLKVFINLQTMKLLSIDPSEISLFRYHHAYIWFHGDKNHHIWLNHHWSNAHMKCQLKLRISHLPYQRSDYNLRILEDVLIIHYFPHSFQHILFQYPYLVKHLIRIRSAKL